MASAGFRHSQNGMTLMEAVVVIGIMALVAFLTAPDVIAWRNNARLRGAADNLRGELQAAKARAARESAWVVIEFFSHHYQVFVDHGGGSGGLKNNGAMDGSEKIVLKRQLPSGVIIESTTFSNDKTNFNPRGTGRAGSIFLKNAAGRRKALIISPMGRIRMEDKS